MTSFDSLDGLSASVNVKEPSKGLFHLIKSLGYVDPINSGIVQVFQSSYCCGRKTASCLIYWNDSVGWASNSAIGENFELFFPNLYIELTGYSFRSVDYDDNIPRNWQVTCSDGTMLHDVVNNKTLCNGVTGLGYTCGFIDEKAFYTTRVIKCKRLKFAISGVESSNSYHFVLSGIELFGSLSSSLCNKNNQKCTHKCNHESIVNAFIVFLLVANR